MTKRVRNDARSTKNGKGVRRGDPVGSLLEKHHLADGPIIRWRGAFLGDPHKACSLWRAEDDLDECTFAVAFVHFGPVAAIAGDFHEILARVIASRSLAVEG